MRDTETGRSRVTVSVWALLFAACTPDPAPAPEPPPAPRAYGEASGEAGPRRLAVGHAWTCALDADRTVRCWGALPWEQGPRPTHEVSELAGAVQIEGTADTLCARDAAGFVKWASSAGITELEELRGATAIGASASLCCAAFEDGHVRCAQDGEVHERAGTGIDDATDLQTAGGLACAMRRENLVTCWGIREENLFERVVPGPIPAAALGSMGSRPCPIDAEGRPACITNPQRLPVTFAVRALEGWGADYCAIDEEGQLLCLDVATRRFTPLGDAPTIAVGVSRQDHVCAMRESGTVECWGDDRQGQSSGTPPTAASTISEVQGIDDAVDVAMARSHACALTSEGALRCWSATDREAHSVEVPGGAVEIAGGGAVCVRNEAGLVSCLRNDGALTPEPDMVATSLREGVQGAVILQDARGDVQLLRPNATRDRSWRTTRLRGTRDLGMLVPLGVCGLRRSAIVCDGVRGRPEMPTVRNVARLFFGGHQRFAVLEDGSVLAWGGGPLGVPPGPGRGGAHSEPVPVEGLSGEGLVLVPRVGATCAYGPNTPLRCTGQLPVLAEPAEPGFRSIEGLEHVRAVALRGGSGCAVVPDGNVRCWGEALRADGQARRLAEPTAVRR